MMKFLIYLSTGHLGFILGLYLVLFHLLIIFQLVLERFCIGFGNHISFICLQYIYHIPL